MATIRKSRNWDKSKIIIGQAKEFFVKGSNLKSGRPGSLQGAKGLYFPWSQLSEVIPSLEGEWWAEEVAYDELSLNNLI